MAPLTAPLHSHQSLIPAQVPSAACGTPWHPGPLAAAGPAAGAAAEPSASGGSAPGAGGAAAAPQTRGKPTAGGAAPALPHLVPVLYRGLQPPQGHRHVVPGKERVNCRQIPHRRAGPGWGAAATRQHRGGGRSPGIGVGNAQHQAHGTHPEVTAPQVPPAQRGALPGGSSGQRLAPLPRDGTSGSARAAHSWHHPKRPRETCPSLNPVPSLGGSQGVRVATPSARGCLLQRT